MGKKYINRELSWLDFNYRVLYQSLRLDIPLMERFNFLNITSSNIDEFIMVRFSSVLNSLNKSSPELSGMTPDEQYDEVLSGILNFKDAQYKAFDTLINIANREGAKFRKYSELTPEQQSDVTKMFNRNIYPILTPMNFDTTKDYPELDSKQLTIVVLLEDDDLQVMSYIPLDPSLDKLYKLSDANEEYITLEELIYGQLDKIFVNKNIVEYGMIKILREADIELDHDTDVYITERMRNTLLRRRYSKPIFMDCSNISKSFTKLLIKVFDLDKNHVYKSSSIIDFGQFTGMFSGNNQYRYIPFKPQFPAELIGDQNMFEAIKSNDILLHHPYESYDPVIRFLQQAAIDSKVISIKQTLYRVSSADSPIVNALCVAARNGKQVSVILEIKARFDEERNISLIDKLKSSGCQLVYGVENYKTHCKFISIVRKEKNKLKIYSHIATGNYNEKTSKIYTDISYFTSNFKIGSDILTIFNMISGFSEPSIDINKIWFSPYNIRSQLNHCIDREISNAKKGKKAFITLKMNSLCDKQIIDKLYTAAANDVKITIFCRGICSMKAVDNVVIRSVVGRFLEHSRIYYFYNNKNPQIYISSADLLTRNLDKRFELMLPITDDVCFEKIIKILQLYYRDTFNSFAMDKKGRYEKIHVKESKSLNIHSEFIHEAVDNYKFKSMPKLYNKAK